MSEIAQPQDHKTKPKRFTFKDADGKVRTLPFASEGAENVPGKFTRDAIMSEDDTAQMRLAFALLEACGATQEIIDALYLLPSNKMLETVGNWMQHGDGEGATVPQ